MVKRSKGGFAAKVAKSSVDLKIHCPVCGEAIDVVKYISTINSPENNAMRFKEKMIKVCKCNRNEFYK